MTVSVSADSKRASVDDRFGGGFVVPRIPSVRLILLCCERWAGEFRFNREVD
jgi:hypothetical protein